MASSEPFELPPIEPPMAYTIYNNIADNLNTFIEETMRLSEKMFPNCYDRHNSSSYGIVELEILRMKHAIEMRLTEKNMLIIKQK